MSVEINCDMGESYGLYRMGDDEGMMPHITIANVACGFHGSDPSVMQKTVRPEQVDYYLDRGYDRVAGFVHRANEVEHLRTPAELFAALGLGYDGSPFRPD